MNTSWQPAALGLVGDLRNVFGDRLRSVVAYGPRVEGHDATPLTCLALVSGLGVSDLESLARQTSKWRRNHVATPLVLSDTEFRTSLDSFPLEYGEIIRAHERVYGNDPFEGVAIAQPDLRRACETQIKSHLVHLREGFLESGGQPTAVADLVEDSAPAFTALLRHVAWLSGDQTKERRAATLAGARAAGISDAVVADMISLEHRQDVRTADPARLFPDYIGAVEQLARAVDAWRV
ncbi:MAG TPA: hypothetical protein VM819_16030 [Vicinamibacterales bacterium]|jgi:hypothetical protein|nr:hypothetical protein [Vicinamibacterales bacterium]